MPRGSRTTVATVLAVVVAAALTSALSACGAIVAVPGPQTSTTAAPGPSTSALAAPTDSTPASAATATGGPASAVAPGSAISAPAVSVLSTIPPGSWGIGDSVMLGSRPLLTAAGLRIDAVVGRQFGQAVYRVRAMSRAGRLPRNLLVHLGTNGTISVKDCRVLVDAAGPVRRVFLVTVHAPRSWVAADNVHLRACAASYPARHVMLIDWNRASSRQPGWFYADHIHPNPTGRRAYTSLITRALAANRV